MSSIFETIIEEEETEDKPIIDDVTGEEIIMAPAVVREPSSKDEYQKRPKQYVNGVDVSILVSRELYFDHEGKPITTSLKDYTKNIIQ